MSRFAVGTPVAALLRTVAREVVMPRYRQLAAHEIEEKSPGELVTVADRESEARLNDGLALILPEARLLGEEAAAVEPALLDRAGEGLVWIIDPIDGTANFAAGRPHFALMIGLVDQGEPLAGWIYDPLTDRMCHAAQGKGAFINGERVMARESGQPLPVAAISFKYTDPNVRERQIERTQGRVTPVDPPMCAGEQYPRVALGQNDIALFERTLPWDHVPGALFLNEAGGKVARPDGSAYRLRGQSTGLLATSSPAMWDRAASLLFA